MTPKKTFEREDRYIVVKRKHLSEEQATAIEQTFEMHDIAQVPLAVVVEGDWPEYEPVWSMIEARVGGRPFIASKGSSLEAKLLKMANYHRCNGPREWDVNSVEAVARLAGLQLQVGAALQALAEYRERPFRSADWLADRMMDIFNGSETKGDSPCHGIPAQTSEMMQKLTELLKAIAEHDLTTPGFRVLRNDVADLVISNSAAILAALAAANDSTS